jgi:5-methylthioadenosine/S-adenosylhomocysteine deaminase
MVNGRILYVDGEFNIGFEPETVYEKANSIINRMR